MATTNKVLRQHLTRLAEAIPYDPGCEWCTSGDYRESTAPYNKHPRPCAMRLVDRYREVD
jgi:hypothetical protein